MCRRPILPAFVVLAVCAAFGSLARADIESGLVVYWPLDGDAADATGDGNVGTIHGSVRPGVDRFGYQYRALHFPGKVDAYIDFPGHRGLLPRYALTVAAWVRADAWNRDGQIVTLLEDHGHPRSCSLLLNLDGAVQFGIGDETSRSRLRSPPLVFGSGQWFHVAGVFRPGEALEVWVNGQLAARRPVTIVAHFTDSNGLMQVGGIIDPWQGDIDEVRVYARALSSADVNELYTFAPAPVFKASNPQPADGAVNVPFSQVAWPVTWKSGVTADLHNLYFGKTPILGPEDFVAPLGAPVWGPWDFPEPGTTCYWRVDEVEADGKTIHTGDTWHFTMRPEAPFDPWPADGATSVSTEVDLGWSSVGGGTQKVYFAADPTALAEGRGNHCERTISRERFDPGLLEMGTRYFWRVEDTSVPDILGGSMTFVGPVWSFTTADLPVIDDFESYGPDDSYCNHVHDTWLGQVPNVICDPGPCVYPPYLERTIVQSGRQAMVFDYNNVVEPYYSEVQRARAAAQNWTVAGADTLVLHVRGLATNDPAPLCVVVEDTPGKQAVAVHPDPQVLLATKWVEWRIPLSNLTGVNLAKVKMVRLGVGDRRNPTPGGLGWVYVDDVRVIGSAQLALLYPPDGAVDVPQRTTLQWRYDPAARGYDVYFGADADAVGNATLASAGVYRGRQDGAYAVLEPGPLACHQTCFWRVDRVSDLHPGSPCKGPVWRFTTADELVIDDFERYNDEEGQATRLYETWIDVWFDGCELQWGGCPALENLEGGVVHGGRQAMAFDYNDTPDPWSSVVERDWSWLGQPPVDLTIEDVGTLVLFVRGLATNDPALLYVSLEDTTRKVATVVHPDPQLLLVTDWTEWRIPLGRFAGPDLTQVRKMRIGVGDPADPTSRALGRIYIDDIRVIKGAS